MKAFWVHFCEGVSSCAVAYFFMLSLGFAPCTISFYPSAPLGVLLSIDTKVPKITLFGGMLLHLLLLEGFSFLRPFLLCCRFDSHRVLYLFIRPLRWGGTFVD